LTHSSSWVRSYAYKLYIYDKLAHINCTSSNMKFVVVQKVVNSGNVKWVF